ncbi:hypothetical protein, partial [Nitrosomonas sp.]|uniref:hypothetical protein n=1 Tax=Nitrosomonas sp. TaxID=42353 RepID=UPI0037C5DBD0
NGLHDPLATYVKRQHALAFLQQVNYAPTDFGGKFGSIAHSSILSKVGAFPKPEEIYFAYSAALPLPAAVLFHWGNAHRAAWSCMNYFELFLLIKVKALFSS